MNSEINFGKLAALVKAKRQGRGLRDIAKDIGDVSPSTLSRIEGERVNDMATSTFLLICDWLGVAPADLISGESSESPPKMAESDDLYLQLRASKDLNPKTAEMLAEMLKAAYQKAKDLDNDSN